MQQYRMDISWNVLHISGIYIIQFSIKTHKNIDTFITYVRSDTARALYIVRSSSGLPPWTRGAFNTPQ